MLTIVASTIDSKEGVYHGFRIKLYGNARGYASEGVELLKQKNFEQAKQSIQKAQDEILISKRKHAELLRDLSSKSCNEINLLLIHAEDHVSSSDLALNFAVELFDIYEILGHRKEY